MLNIGRGWVGDPAVLFSLRQLVVKNGPESPFEQVLAWLAKGGDYFTAASIALDLLQDGDTLLHLWRNAEMVDEEVEETKLDGLLDGIAPIQLVDEQNTTNRSSSVYVVHLADMTVGCLIKGGAPMAETLRLFLKENRYYDPARACLMLAATTARLLGEKLIGGGDMDVDVLWPVDCLLQIGRARDYLDTVLLLLNVTIPDELRCRPESIDQQQLYLHITLKLVAMIVSYDLSAIDLLLELKDEESHVGYWKSLSNGTQMELSLIEVDSSFPMIQNPEVRAWVREGLNLCLKNENDLSSAWIQRLTTACLVNAGCELSDFQMELEPTHKQTSFDSLEGANTGTALSRAGRGESLNIEDDDERLMTLKMKMIETRNALVASSDGYSLDFDLLIPCLLILESRNAPWLNSKQSVSENVKYVSTQTLLDAACYLAGRRPNAPAVITTAKKEDHADDKPFLFAEFDSSTAMKQCYLAGNVSAGAYLIGGKNGFVLHLCQMLYENMGVSISDGERLILNDNLDLRLIDSAKVELSSFELTDTHRRLLLLLDEHVLSVKTFGEFETIHIRGRVEPVFAARSVFRAWLSLSYGDKRASSNWLCQWLSRRLEIGEFAVGAESQSRLGSDRAKQTAPSMSSSTDGGSASWPRHRLACAAIARSLIWSSVSGEADTDDYDGGGSGSGNSTSGDASSLLLANVMEMEKKFLIEVCEACVGLVESVPPRAVQ